MWFPIDTGKGVVTNGVWEIDFGPYDNERIIQFISLTGPASSSVNVFVDTIFMDTTARGDFNRADYFNGIPLARGRLLRLVWSVGTGTVPVASVGMTDGKTDLEPF